MQYEFRLTQEQKSLFNELVNTKGASYEQDESDDINDLLEENLNALDEFNAGPQYILISKPEVHPQVWNALRKNNAGKVVDFENGDVDPSFRKGMQVNKNLLEALFDLLKVLIIEFTNMLTGKRPGSGNADGPSKARTLRRDAESAYER